MTKLISAFVASAWLFFFYTELYSIWCISFTFNVSCHRKWKLMLTKWCFRQFRTTKQWLVQPKRIASATVHWQAGKHKQLTTPIANEHEFQYCLWRCVSHPTISFKSKWTFWQHNCTMSQNTVRFEKKIRKLLVPYEVTECSVIMYGMQILDFLSLILQVEQITISCETIAVDCRYLPGK